MIFRCRLLKSSTLHPEPARFCVKSRRALCQALYLTVPNSTRETIGMEDRNGKGWQTDFFPCPIFSISVEAHGVGVAIVNLFSLRALVSCRYLVLEGDALSPLHAS